MYLLSNNILISFVSIFDIFKIVKQINFIALFKIDILFTFAAISVKIVCTRVLLSYQ